MVDPVTGTAAAYLLASSGKAGEVSVTVVATKAAEGLVRKIEDSVNKKWNGSEKQKKRIKDLAKQCRVIRPSESLKLKEYAKSPILNYMKRPQSRGTIYVAYVPAGMGKRHHVKLLWTKATLPTALHSSPPTTPCLTLILC
jgi:hypothetical protein